VLGSGGVGDKAYIMDENNIDKCLLTKFYAGPHDLGIKTIATAKTVAGQGYSININATIIKYGEQQETFNVTFKADNDNPNKNSSANN